MDDIARVQEVEPPRHIQRDRRARSVPCPVSAIGRGQRMPQIATLQTRQMPSNRLGAGPDTSEPPAAHGACSSSLLQLLCFGIAARIKAPAVVHLNEQEQLKSQA